MKPVGQWLVSAAAITAWMLITIFAGDTPLKITVSAAFLMYFPGKLLGSLIAPRTLQKGFWHDVSLSTGLSLVLLMVLGLIMSVTLPSFGLKAPLSAGPLTLAITLMTGALLGLNIAKRRVMFVPTPREHLRPYALAVGGLVTLVPVLAGLGAISLNNGGGGILAGLSMAIIAITIAILSWRDKPSLAPIMPYAIYMISLGLLIGTSLRGYHITGHDVMQEFQVFQLTATNGVWNMAFLRDAYNACLSITILPTILAKLTKLSDPYIYKILFQFMFALMPVALFITARRFASRRAAFLAAMLFVTFPVYLQDMSMLARQETAFLLLTLAFMVMFDTEIKPRIRSIFALILLGGMVLSHYSTSYITVDVLLSAKSLELFIRTWRRAIHRRAANIWAPLSWTSILVIALFTYVWNGQITQTSKSITKTITAITQNIPHLIDHAFVTGQSNYSLVGTGYTPQQVFAAYTDDAAKFNRDMPADQYYPGSLTELYPISLRTETLSPPTSFAKSIGIGNLDLYGIYEIGRQTYAKLLQLLIVLAVGIMLIKPRSNRLPRQYQLIGISFMAMVVLQVLLPPSIIDYGLLRLLHQALIFLSLPVILMCLKFAGWLRIPSSFQLRGISFVIIAFFLVLSGLANQITGGHKPALALSSTGFYYEAYYTHDDELAGFNWLRTHAPYGAIVNADEFARRKMVTYTGIYPRPSMTPDTIGKDAYVFISHSNTETGKLPVYYGGNLIYQSLPTDFLDDTKDEVYSTGSVSIYQ